MLTKRSYCDDFRAITSRRSFCFCVFLVALAAFGFATFNMAVSRDDLQGYMYVGEGQNMLASGRFTVFLVDRLTSTTIHGPITAYTNDLLAILGLVWAAINFCIFFRRILGDTLSNAACTVFTCFFISYPLITELWEYLGAYRIVAFGFLCVSFALILMYDVIHKQSSCNRRDVLITCILMMLVCAGYESLVSVYIFCVCAILALQVIYGSEKEKKLTEIIHQGLCYAGVLAVGLILRVVVHKIILFVLQIDYAANGDTVIRWGKAPFVTTLLRTLWLIVRDYVLRAIVYFPLTELIVAAIILLMIGIVACKRHGRAILLPGFGMYLSLIILSLVQGCVTGYRTCQVFAIFVAFVAMLIVFLAEQGNRPWLRIAVLVLCGYLCFHQADQTNYFLTLNYMRSEEELRVVQDIGTELQENYDTGKPVVFVGSYALHDEIMEAASIPEDSLRWKVYHKIYSAAGNLLEQMNFESEEPSRFLPQSNIYPVIYFGLTSFDGTQESLQHLFSFAGYGYVLPTHQRQRVEAKTYAAENNMPGYPKTGYIEDVGEYIIVHLQ